MPLQKELPNSGMASNKYNRLLSFFKVYPLMVLLQERGKCVVHRLLDDIAVKRTHTNTHTQHIHVHNHTGNTQGTGLVVKGSCVV